MAKQKVHNINALSKVKMDFSTLGIRSSLRDYELAYWLNFQYGFKFISRPDVEKAWDEGTIWEYNVYDGNDPNGEHLCLINNLSSGVQEKEKSDWSLFESAPEKHLLPSVKHWDYVLIAENAEFAFDLESALKRNDKITTAQYFEAHTQLTQRETHLLYEIRNT